MRSLRQAGSLALFHISPGKQGPHGNRSGDRAVSRGLLVACLAERPGKPEAKPDCPRHHHDEHEQTNQKRECRSHANGSQYRRGLDQFGVYEPNSKLAIARFVDSTTLRWPPTKIIGDETYN